MPNVPGAVKKSLERAVIELCERLPGNMTLLEKNGLCENPSDYCTYCQQIGNFNYFCKKKTYTPITQPKEI